ncbi:hypothetical protein CVD25_06470 [Bacillus canaveralius]|uniref:Uncharacterized protein n=1 Tax=Bacillus canaveralius TaxID=1403243 RepID=A0A2N5GG29_9BACI|nr:sigma-70 family RNA polymerase sigma factor [Bacillus canaveralius]PLR79706.1 hypothetical protein CU635_21675 [Bacillus canaveralius]PLR99162.1 hypothetical protein CVD25_06470 [Bacillus canaveralius]
MNWINHYWQLEEEISEIEWDIEKSNLEFKRWNEHGDLFNKNSFQVSLENQIRVIHSIQDLEGLLVEKKNLKAKLLERIETFKGLDNQILKMKYIDCMTLEQIAEELKYSASHIRKRHAEIKRMDKYAESLRG